MIDWVPENPHEVPDKDEEEGHDLPHRTVSSGNSLPVHRLDMNHRAKKNNAAEHYDFREKKSLIYHFLDVEDEQVRNDDGEMEDGRYLRCGFGCTNRWIVRKSGGGSTSNFINHMNRTHGKTWDSLQKLDNAAMGKAAAEKGLQDLSRYLKQVSSRETSLI